MNAKIFVLVHGAYHGGWCWRDVAAQLRAQGHAVFAPTLAGLGERAHLIDTDPDLDTHIDDVVQLIESEKLRDVTLVGHSYAGAVISGVADRIRATIAQLIYLDAIILQPGATMLDAVSAEALANYRAMRRENGGSGSVPIPPVEFFGVTDPAHSAWLTRELTPHPVNTFFSVMRLQHPIGNHLPVTYIACTDPLFRQAEPSHLFAKAQREWTYMEIAESHDAMVTAPIKIVELLNKYGR